VLAAAAAAAASTVAFAVTIAHLACGPGAVVSSPGAAPAMAVSLARAVELAERQSPGQATVASLQPQGSGWVYVVRLEAPAGAAEVRVDAEQGDIVSVSAE